MHITTTKNNSEMTTGLRVLSDKSLLRDTKLNQDMIFIFEFAERHEHHLRWLNTKKLAEAEQARLHNIIWRLNTFFTRYGLSTVPTELNQFIPQIAVFYNTVMRDQ